MGPFFWFPVWFSVFSINCKSSHNSDRIARAFKRSGANRAVALDISKVFKRVWHAGLLHKPKSYGILGQIFGLISSFLSNRRLRVVLDGKSSQEYPVNAGVPQGSILGPTLFLLYIKIFPGDVICDIAIYAVILLTILSVIKHLICGSNLNWLLNLNLICKTLWTGARSGMLILILGKLNWFRLISLITLVLLMWKWMGLFLRKDHLLRCWSWPSLLNWIGLLILSLLLKLPSRKLGS